jgi:hypothetical protein
VIGLEALWAVYLDDLELRAGLQNFGEVALSGRIEVKHDRERDAAMLRHLREKLLARIQPASRRSDRDRQNR